MAIIATNETPPPAPAPRRKPRKSPKTDPVQVSGRLPLVVKWSEHLKLPDGRLATVTHLWLTVSAWRRGREAHEKGWRSRTLGFIVVAYRVDW